MKNEKNSNRMFGVRMHIFSAEAASQIADFLKSEEPAYTPVEMLSLHCIVLMFLENADKLGVLTLFVAKAITMLRKQEEVTISYTRSDGTPVSMGCKSPDALKFVKEIITELEKNSVQDLTIDIAGSSNKMTKD